MVLAVPATSGRVPLQQHGAYGARGGGSGSMGSSFDDGNDGLLPNAVRHGFHDFGTSEDTISKLETISMFSSLFPQ
jgi:hypothetical protein